MYLFIQIIQARPLSLTLFYLNLSKNGSQPLKAHLLALLKGTAIMVLGS